MSILVKHSVVHILAGGTMAQHSAKHLIIGGGIIGCSIAYHLTRMGEKDVVLLERANLT